MFPAGVKRNRDTQKFSLKDSKGADVPTYNSYSWYGGDANFYPKSNLKYGERYTATFEYTNKNTGQKVLKTWSFTTRTEDWKITEPTNPTKPTNPNPPVNDGINWEHVNQVKTRGQGDVG